MAGAARGAAREQRGDHQLSRQPQPLRTHICGDILNIAYSHGGGSDRLSGTERLIVGLYAAQESRSLDVLIGHID